MRIVLDTNILIRASAKARGPARALLMLIAASASHRLLLSPFLLNELKRVLSYDRIRVSARLTDSDAEEYIAYLETEGFTERIDPGAPPRVVPSDPDDDAVVHLAVVGEADVLCTLNRDFYAPEVVAYCRSRGVLVCRDLELLALLRNFKQTHN